MSPLGIGAPSLPSPGRKAMFYPTWDNATSYPVGSIVSFNGLLYLATLYHNPASTTEPNVEMGTNPSAPVFFGSQRSWTIYGALPPGYSPSPFILTTAILTRKLDPNDDYDFGGQFAPGIYGDDQGISKQEYAGSVNNPTTPCPASKCDVNLNDIRGSIYGSNAQYIYELFNPVLSSTGDYYINGPLNPDGETNTLYVWWATQSPSRFRRSITINAQTGYDEFTFEPINETETFVPDDNTYSVGGSYDMRRWIAPGNQSATFVSMAMPGVSFVPVLLNAYEIAPND